MQARFEQESVSVSHTLNEALICTVSDMYNIVGNFWVAIFLWFSWLEKNTNFLPTNVQTTCTHAQVAN